MVLAWRIKAYEKFFNKRAKFPKFKRKHGKQSFRLTNNAFSFNPEILQTRIRC